MHARANRLRGHTRLHTPTTSEPLFVAVIDEIAALTAYVTDRKVRTEVEQLLGLLLSQGRAVGISVVAAVQDPAKDTLPVRQLFTVRIGLRLTEATQTTMVLGQGARDAACVWASINAMASRQAPRSPSTTRGRSPDGDAPGGSRPRTERATMVLPEPGGPETTRPDARACCGRRRRKST